MNYLNYYNNIVEVEINDIAGKWMWSFKAEIEHGVWWVEGKGRFQSTLLQMPSNCQGCVVRLADGHGCAPISAVSLP